MKNALADAAKKDGIEDTPQAMFAYLIERVRSNLHVVIGMSPVGEAFRYCFQIQVVKAFSHQCFAFMEYPRCACCIGQRTLLLFSGDRTSVGKRP